MAKQTLTYNTVTGNWELTETNQGKTYTNTLLTDNKNISGDIDINITARNATTSMPASLSGSSANVSLSGSNITLVKTLTNTANIAQTGWIDSLSGNTKVSLSGVVPTEEKEVKSSSTTATITPTSGKLINKVTVKPILLESKTVTPSTSTQTITATSGKDGLSQVVVNAITVGIAGTPVAEKGTVSSNKVTITPKVTNVEGYINGGKITGTPITVTASELVSGGITITNNANGITVTNLAYVDVQVPSAVTPYTVSSAGTFTPSSSYVGFNQVEVAGGTLTPGIEMVNVMNYFNSGTSEDYAAKITKKAAVTRSGWIDADNYIGDTIYLKIKEADNFSLSIANNTGTVNVGTLSSGYYPLTTSLSATLTAGTHGWFSSGNATDNVVQVGKIKAATIDINASGGTSSGTIGSGKQIKIENGYVGATVYYDVEPSETTPFVVSLAGTFTPESPYVGFSQVSVAAGTITNNTSGGSSSGTINRGSQIKISAGYYDSDIYYIAQENSGVMPTTITSNGTHSCDGYTAVYVNVPAPSYSTYDGYYTISNI